MGRHAVVGTGDPSVQRRRAHADRSASHAASSAWWTISSARLTAGTSSVSDMAWMWVKSRNGDDGPQRSWATRARPRASLSHNLASARVALWDHGSIGVGG